jgi:hypothetical protein
MCVVLDATEEAAVDPVIYWSQLFIVEIPLAEIKTSYLINL